MKKQVLVALAIVGVFALVGAAPANAQTVSRVNVPFPFIVGDTVLPAGAYTVTNPAYRSDVVTIQSADGKALATALVQSGGDLSKNANATFSFRKIGGQYFLAELNIPGSAPRVLSLPKSHVEAMLAKLNGTKVHTGPAL